MEEDVGSYISESLSLPNVVSGQGCSNENVITGEPYTSTDKRFYVYTGDKFSDAHCVNANDEIVAAVQADYGGRNTDYASFFSIGGGNPIEEYGCKMTSKYIFKLTLQSPYFITLGSLVRVFQEPGVSEWYLVKLFNGKRRRIINLIESYGSGRHHCQVPGYHIYKAFTRQELLNGVSLDEVDTDYLPNPQISDIRENIRQYILGSDTTQTYFERVRDELLQGKYTAIQEQKWTTKDSFDAIGVLSWIKKAAQARYLPRYFQILETKGINPDTYEPEVEGKIRTMIDTSSKIPEVRAAFRDWVRVYDERNGIVPPAVSRNIVPSFPVQRQPSAPGPRAVASGTRVVKRSGRKPAKNSGKRSVKKSGRKPAKKSGRKPAKKSGKKSAKRTRSGKKVAKRSGKKSTKKRTK